jgi:XRE family transcriptional regulator, aerobic/anaerobic benzoate catabolism transcriptional regulator
MSATATLKAQASGATRIPAKQAVAASDSGLLVQLGERVRAARARRSMTRKDLAVESQVSERYLAQLESGHGNISVLLLRQIAVALGLTLADLLHEEADNSAEVALISQFLQRLPPRKLAEVRAHLVRKFGNGKDERHGRVALVGLRGAGKSTLGARLAKELGVAFLELDQEIEREAGTSLSEIFLLYGQAGYRRYERRCLENLLKRRDRFVLATGGSIVSEASTYDLLLSSCYTIWLKALPEEHMARVVAQGDTRPMAGNNEAMADLKRILAARAALYGQADALVDTAQRSVAQSAKDLKKLAAHLQETLA